MKNPKNLVVGHLNINSLRNKFKTLKLIVSPICDIYLVSETNIYESWNGKQNNNTHYTLSVKSLLTKFLSVVENIYRQIINADKNYYRRKNFSDEKNGKWQKI